MSRSSPDSNRTKNMFILWRAACRYDESGLASRLDLIGVVLILPAWRSVSMEGKHRSWEKIMAVYKLEGRAVNGDHGTSLLIRVTIMTA